ncbi:MAG: glycosyltransferase family 2 protein [Armatimonadota bacterium]
MNITGPPKVKIIVLSWNNKNLLNNILLSLRNTDYSDFNITVVDNGSTDGSQNMVEKEFPSMEIIKNKENLGVGRGFNTGIKQALKEKKYKYICLIDQDLTVEKNTLKELVKLMEENPSAGLAGPKVINADYPHVIMETGAKIDWEKTTSAPFQKGKLDDPHEERIFKADYIPLGCATLMRTEALNKVGLLKEGYFYLWEDIDWGMRFKESGYKVLATTKARVLHSDITLKRGNPVTRYYSCRNSLYFFHKHSPDAIYKLKSIQRAWLSYFFYKIWGYDNYAFASRRAIKDFFKNNTGKTDEKFDIPVKHTKINEDTLRNTKIKKVLIFPEEAGEVQASIEKLKEITGDFKFDVIVEKYKKNQFIKPDYKVFTYDIYSVKSSIMLLLDITKNNYDIVLTTKEVFSPVIGLCNFLKPILILKDNEFYIKKRDTSIPLKYLFASSAAKFMASFKI